MNRIIEEILTDLENDASCNWCCRWCDLDYIEEFIDNEWDITIKRNVLESSCDELFENIIIDNHKYYLFGADEETVRKELKEIMG